MSKGVCKPLTPPPSPYLCYCTEWYIYNECVFGLQKMLYITNNADATSSGENMRPDHPVANLLHDGQENVTDVESLVKLMRGTKLSLIGRSDLLGIKTETMFRRLSDESFVRQLAMANRQRSAGDADTAAQPANEQMGISNKLQVTAADTPNDRLDIDKNFAGIFDLKITTAHADGFMAASGPPFTMDSTEVEPFRWSDSPIKHLPHHGHPDTWDYDLDTVNWVWD